MDKIELSGPIMDANGIARDARFHVYERDSEVTAKSEWEMAFAYHCQKNQYEQLGPVRIKYL